MVYACGFLLLDRVVHKGVEMLGERFRKLRKLLCLFCTFDSSLCAVYTFNVDLNVDLRSVQSASCQRVNVLSQDLRVLPVDWDEFGSNERN